MMTMRVQKIGGEFFRDMLIYDSSASGAAHSIARNLLDVKLEIPHGSEKSIIGLMSVF